MPWTLCSMFDGCKGKIIHHGSIEALIIKCCGHHHKCLWILTNAWSPVLDIHIQKDERNVLIWILTNEGFRSFFHWTVQQTVLICLLDISLQSAPVLWPSTRRWPVQRLACLFCMFAWIADNSGWCLHDRRELQTFLWSPRPCGAAVCPSQSSASRGSGLIFCSRRIGPRLFCCTQRSRSLTETMGLIWIIKEVRHYDTVSLCRGGRLANIQEHWLNTTVSPSLNSALFLVWAWNKLQAWVGPWM